MGDDQSYDNFIILAPPWQKRKNTYPFDEVNASPYLFHNFTENKTIMTTIVINEKTKKGRIILDLIREMGVGEIIESKKGSGHIPNDTTMKAIRDADEGKTIKCTDYDDYLSKVK